MVTIERLAEIFAKFPGIGFRQSRRFVYFLLGQTAKDIEEFVSLVLKLKKEARTCLRCRRFFAGNFPGAPHCRICGDPNRDPSVFMIVSRDTDLEAIEQSGFYNGRYFVIGGTVPILEKKPAAKIKDKELMEEVRKLANEGKLQEIIIAMNLNPEGENTASYLERLLLPLIKQYRIKLTALGRGLSTGTELEYSDADTIRNALRNRFSAVLD